MVAWWTIPLTFSLLNMSTLSTNSPHPQWFKSIIWFGQTNGDVKSSRESKEPQA